MLGAARAATGWPAGTATAWAGAGVGPAAWPGGAAMTLPSLLRKKAGCAGRAATLAAEGTGATRWCGSGDAATGLALTSVGTGCEGDWGGSAIGHERSHVFGEAVGGARETRQLRAVLCTPANECNAEMNSLDASLKCRDAVT